MADANAIIRELAAQVAQLTVDKTILAVELAELRAKYANTADLEVVEDPAGATPQDPQNSQVPEG